MKLLITILVLTTPLVLSLRNKRASWNDSREDDFKKIISAVLDGHVEWYIAKDMDGRLTIPLPDSQLRTQARVSDGAFSAAQNQFSYLNSQPQYNYQNLLLKNDGYQYPKPSIPFEAMIARSKTIFMTPYLQQGYGGSFIPLKRPTTTTRPTPPEQMTTMTNSQSDFGGLSGFIVPKIPTAPTPISPEMTTSMPSTNTTGQNTSTSTPPQQGLAVLFLELMTPTATREPTSPESMSAMPDSQSVMISNFLPLPQPTRPERPTMRGPTTPRPITSQLESIVDLIQMQIPGPPGAERPLYNVKGYFVPYLSNNS
ncbi:hypothetical protein CBL_21157 [Carabus blaptoides fortunei]